METTNNSSTQTETAGRTWHLIWKSYMHRGRRVTVRARRCNSAEIADMWMDFYSVNYGPGDRYWVEMTNKPEWVI